MFRIHRTRKFHNWSLYPFRSSVSGGFEEEKDRSVAHIHRIRYVSGHSHTVGFTRKRPFPKASVPLCRACVFQCFLFFVFLCFVYVFVWRFQCDLCRSVPCVLISFGPVENSAMERFGRPREEIGPEMVKSALLWQSIYGPEVVYDCLFTGSLVRPPRYRGDD